MNFEDHNWNMTVALEEAYSAWSLGEVPIGAVIIDSNGKFLAKSHNIKESAHNPCGHAEILAIIDAGKKLKNWRLTGATVYVTLEPCPMCMSALLQARIKTLVFGAYDKKGGAISLGYNFAKDSRLNHTFNIVGGIKHFECSKILSNFFHEKRQFYKSKK